MKNIQIDLELFLEIYDYIATDQQPEAVQLRQKMNVKLDKILAHEYYSKYRRAPSAEKRDTAMKEYLKLKNN